MATLSTSSMDEASTFTYWYKPGQFALNLFRNLHFLNISIAYQYPMHFQVFRLTLNGANSNSQYSLLFLFWKVGYGNTRLLRKLFLIDLHSLVWLVATPQKFKNKRLHFSSFPLSVFGTEYLVFYGMADLEPLIRTTVDVWTHFNDNRAYWSFFFFGFVLFNRKATMSTLNLESFTFSSI